MRPRFIRRRLLPLVAVVCLLGTATASAAWLASGSGIAYSEAETAPAGNVPTASASGQDVTVSWGGSTFPGGGAISGYVVKRYNPSDQEQTVLSNCSGTVSGLSCTENQVPAGTWRYTVTPKHQNWTGSESAKSTGVTVTVSNLRVATGTYVGNGTDNRTISHPGFQPDVVIVKAATAQVSVMRSSTMTGDNAKPLTGLTALTANLVQSLTSSGFTIGTDARVNTNGTTYHWTAYQAGVGALKVGSYTGNGNASQAVTGTNFSPEYVAVLGASAQRATQRFSGMTRGFQFDSDTGTTTRVSSLDADGFTVANSAEVNTSAITYHYLAINDVAGSIKVGSYSGNGVDNRNVTGVGFQSDYLMVRSGDTGTGRLGAARPAALTGDSTHRFGALANVANNLQALQADGFQTGTDAAVNANGIIYHYAALKNSAGGCSLPGTSTVTASADSWIDQSSPANNAGADSVLKVTSKASNQNTRAVVQFSMPSQPSGCSVISATLRLNNQAPFAGRTLQALQISAAWTENGVTWTNQPITTGSPATTTTTSTAGWMQWTVTTQVQSIYTGTNYGFQISDQTEGFAGGAEQQLKSKEGSNPPELIVTFG